MDLARFPICVIIQMLVDQLAQLLVHALVTSKLDYCNSLHYSLPKYLIKQLQRVQNAAARVVTVSPKFCHITPVLKNLHWLPIELRIEFKILPLPTRLFMVSLPLALQIFLKTTTDHAMLCLQRKIFLTSLPLAQMVTVRSSYFFCCCTASPGTVFLAILGMLKHLTFLKTAENCFFI